MNDKEEHIILIKRSIHQKGITILNIYRLDNSISKKKKIKAEIDRTKWGKRFQTFIDGSLKSSHSKNQEGEKLE